MTLPPPPPTRLLGDREDVRAIDWSINKSLSGGEHQEPHPFVEVPGLRTALSQQHTADGPSDHRPSDCPVDPVTWGH